MFKVTVSKNYMEKSEAFVGPGLKQIPGDYTDKGYINVLDSLREYNIGTPEEVGEVMENYGNDLPKSVLGFLFDWFGKLFGSKSKKEYVGAYVPQTGEKWLSTDTFKDISLLYKAVGHENTHEAIDRGLDKLPYGVDEEDYANMRGEYAANMLGRN